MSTHLKIKKVSFGHRQGRLLERIAAHPSNYWIGFASDPAAALFFIFWDAVVLRSNPYVLTLCFVTGLLSWTLLEYCFHRWVYHKGSTLAHAGHRLHHESPEVLIGMPWFIISGFLLSVWYVLAYRYHIPYILPCLAGLVMGFVAYGVFHHIHHHFNIKGSRYRKLKAHHNIHHQFPEVNFGVTNRFWDYVFGTHYRQTANRQRYIRRAAKERRTEETSGRRGVRSDFSAPF